MRLMETIEQVRQLFTEYDGRLDAFKASTQLACVAGCGHCCNNPRVEATVIEFLPLAQQLCARRESLDWLDRITEGGLDGVCAFYMPTSPDGENGFCSIYPWRGLICRLFGYSARLNKHGLREFIACKVLKANAPETVQAAQQRTSEDATVPVMALAYLRLAAIEPSLAHERVPINEAIAKAIERVEFHNTWDGQRCA